MDMAVTDAALEEALQTHCQSLESTLGAAINRALIERPANPLPQVATYILEALPVETCLHHLQVVLSHLATRSAAHRSETESAQSQLKQIRAKSTIANKPAMKAVDGGVYEPEWTVAGWLGSLNIHETLAQILLSQHKSSTETQHAIACALPLREGRSSSP